MKKIFCNTKMKKILIITMITLLLVNFIFPAITNIVCAAVYSKELFHPNDPGRWGQSCAPEELDDNLTEKKRKKYTNESSLVNCTDWQYEQWIKDEKDYQYLLNIGNQDIDAPDYNENNEWDNDYDATSIKLAVDKHNTSLKESYEHNTNPNTAQGDKIKLVDALNKAINAAVTEGNEREEQLDYDEEEVVENLGGILLSPVFYLINFVADAVISNLSNIMTGEGGILGLKILSIDKPVAGDVEGVTPYIVNENIFVPDVVGAITQIFNGTGLQYQYPHINYTPEEIFSGQIDLLSIDFINAKSPQKDANGDIVKDANGNIVYTENSDSAWMNIRNVISQWYNVLRMIAIIGLLCVLIYTGIKILISANAKDKAKYKEWIVNWFMAVAILFSMHIIMAFIVYVTTGFSQLLAGASKDIVVQVAKMGENGEILEIKDTFSTNLMGLVRFMVQSENFYMKIGYEVMYIALIMYTLKFTFVYLKRVLNMAFLTLIAPIVALTYPIDKINDGKAQGFDMWLKEYTFNALLQPMHLILYYILLGSAVGIAATNPIYGIVVLAFMTEAEKLLKKIFGFGKASEGTVGGLGGAFAAGALASNITKFAKNLGGSGGKGGKGSAGLDGDTIYKNPKPLDDNGEDKPLFDSSNSSSGTNNNTSNTGDTGGSGSPDNKDTSKRLFTNPLKRKNSDGSGNGSTSGNDSKSDSGKSIRKMKNGLKNVGRRLISPVCDTSRSAQYNKKRLRRKIRKAAIGTALGIGAAAVQAGISITDGKYNFGEGALSFAAGFGMADKLLNTDEKIANIYAEGRDEGDNEAIVRGIKDRWDDRDDVRKYNQKYTSEEMKYIPEIQKALIERGMDDPKEMDKCIKYLKASGKSLDQLTTSDIKQAAYIHDKSAEVKGYGINSFKDDDVQKYISSRTKGKSNSAELEAQMRDEFELIKAYQIANKVRN